jgi:hypothetical protein
VSGKSTVLVNLFVILRVVQHRQPFWGAASAVLAHAEIGTIDGYATAHGLTTVHYLIAWFRSVAQARVAVAQTESALAIPAIDEMVVRGALELTDADLADATQTIAAVDRGADYVVTRNKADYRAGPLPALRPAELLALL